MIDWSFTLKIAMIQAPIHFYSPTLLRILTEQNVLISVSCPHKKLSAHNMQTIFFLCFATFIYPLASGQPIQLELEFENFPSVCARGCLTCVLRICLTLFLRYVLLNYNRGRQYKDLGCGNPILKECFCGLPNPLSCMWKSVCPI